jgi:uncharacterized membrane protein
MFSIFGRKFHESETKIADLITNLAGSMLFVYLHILGFTLFFIFNPFEKDLFNIILSLEAVFLATLIMVSQNRQAEIAEQRDIEEDQEQEEIAEDIEDIQQEFDEIQEDLSEVRRLIEKIETRLPAATEQATRPQEDK